MNATQKDLETKSKAVLVENALQIIKEKHPEIIIKLSDFDSRVWENEYGNVCVIFRRAIRYVLKVEKPTNYDITVNLISKEITSLDTDKISFYQPSKKEENSIAELKKKGLLPNEIIPDIEYTITENDTYYLISCFNDLYHIDKNSITNTEKPYLSKSLINKKTGEIIYFKGANPFYFLSQTSFKHYYEENLFTVLEEQTTNEKNEIVEIAKSILQSKQPQLKLSPNDFEIIVLGNYKDIIVKFRRFIRFTNNTQKKVFDLAVNIITKEIFPFNDSNDSFYIPSESDVTTIQTLQKKLNLALASNMEHTISENEDYFWITSLSEKLSKKYFFNKETKEVVCFDESFTLPINNREDISLEEQYKRTNGFFTVKPESNEQLIEIALILLKENYFLSKINPDDYFIKIEASKDEVKVKFTNVIKFIPLKHKKESNYKYDFEVNLVTKTINHPPKELYFPTKEDFETIELIHNKLIRYLKDSEEIKYPLEITEEKDKYIIKTANSFSIKKNATKHYILNKETKIIETILSPSYFYPTPASLPPTFNEIKE